MFLLSRYGSEGTKFVLKEESSVRLCDGARKRSCFACGYTETGVIPGRSNRGYNNENHKSFVRCIKPSDTNDTTTERRASERKPKKGRSPRQLMRVQKSPEKYSGEVKCCMSFGEERRPTRAATRFPVPISPLTEIKYGRTAIFREPQGRARTATPRAQDRRTGCDVLSAESIDRWASVKGTGQGARKQRARSTA